MRSLYKSGKEASLSWTRRITDSSSKLAVAHCYRLPYLTSKTPEQRSLSYLNGKRTHDDNIYNLIHFGKRLENSTHFETLRIKNSFTIINCNLLFVVFYHKLIVRAPPVSRLVVELLDLRYFCCCVRILAFINIWVFECCVSYNWASDTSILTNHSNKRRLCYRNHLRFGASRKIDSLPKESKLILIEGDCSRNCYVVDS